MLAQIYMYGTTSSGGINGLGTIYKVDQFGNNFEKVYDFTASSGGNPSAGLTLANGKLYGFTTSEGTLAPGAIDVFGSFFSFDPITSTFTVIKYLDNLSTIGYVIKDAPLLASNGLLYGVSESSYENGSVLGSGKLFSYNPVTGVFNTLYDFNLSTGTVQSKLMQATNRKIYMISADGGFYKRGSIMTYDLTTNALATIYVSRGYNNPDPGPNDFERAANNPLIQASNGKIYLASKFGGNGNLGVTSMLNPDGSSYQINDSFESLLVNQGTVPAGGLLQIGEFLYGTTLNGDDVNFSYGTIYKRSLSSSNSTVTFLKTLDIYEGSKPNGSFVKNPTFNRIYTTCKSGGNNIQGTIIEFNLDTNKFRVTHNFQTVDGTAPDRGGLTIVDFATLSVKDVALKNTVVIYPNPTSTSFTVGMDNVESIEIFNLLGQKVQTAKNTKTVNIENLENGVYMLNIKSENKSHTAKLIKD